MKPNTSQLTHHVENVDETMRMTIDQDSIAHLMQILTDLYSNPILAVIREYSTNALDSHIEAGNPAPIEITLPTQMKPEFVVKDQGLGLNVDDMRDVYSMYGRSTKRASDMVTGMLGLGCKSGLTYSLSFSVTGIKDGLKTIATVTKDADGVGAIKILDTVATDEPNGVIVKIPVKVHDVNRFENEALNLFKYWKDGTVTVVGHELDFPDNALWLDPDVAVFSKPYSQESKIVMGGVAYPWESGIQGLSIVAWVPMGAVNFTPSREALHFTSRTDACLEDIRTFAKERLTKSIEDAIKAAATPFEKLEVALEWWAQARGLLKDHWSQQGKLEMPLDKHAWQFMYGGYKGSASKAETVSLSSLINKNMIVITEWPNLTVPAGARERIKQFVADNDIKRNTALILPEGSKLHYLTGREHVYDWQHILDNTDKPTLVRGGSKTVYSVHHKNAVADVHKVTGTAPIIYSIGNPTAYNSYVFSDFPEAQGVVIQRRQEDKFLRLHPKAMTVGTYRSKQIEKFRKQLTDADKMMAGDLHAYRGFVKYVSKILDPELQTVVKLIGKGHSNAWNKFKALGGRFDEEHAVHATLQKRYPLLAHVRHIQAGSKAMDDIIDYFNFKYNETNP